MTETQTSGGGLRVASFRPYGKLILVKATYDTDKIYSSGLIIPDFYKNPLPQQGIVEAVGPKQDVIKVGDHLLFHPWAPHERVGVMHMDGEHWVFVSIQDVAAIARDMELYPLPNDVLILPAFRAVRPSKPGLIYISGELAGTERPQAEGLVVRVGRDVTLVAPGEDVLLPEVGGNEIGFIDKVWYTIKEVDLLGVL